MKYLLILALLSTPVLADSGETVEIEDNPETKAQAEAQNEQGTALNRAYRELREQELIPEVEDLQAVQEESDPLMAESCVRDTELWDDRAFEQQYIWCGSVPGGGAGMLPKRKPVSGN